VTPNRSDLFFLWEVQDGAPEIGTGQSLEVEFRSSGTKTVIVTAFTEDGCTVMATAQIKIPG
jgi:hypothetical protein